MSLGVLGDYVHITVIAFYSEDPLEKEMAAHSSILAQEIPWTEESGGLQSMGSQKNQTQLSDNNIKTPHNVGPGVLSSGVKH